MFDFDPRDYADARDGDLDAYEDPRDTTLDHLQDEGLIRFVQINGDECAAVLTDRGWDVLDAAATVRTTETKRSTRGLVARLNSSTTQLFRAYLKVEKRLREEGAEIERIVLARDLRSEYEEFLQEHNRDRPDNDGRPDRDARDSEEWSREQDLPYFDESVHLPDLHRVRPRWTRPS
ncbi:MAG TPA: hypothetical protein VES67_24115 [Vicinamibacterales bacterium]|nr:hypothetical protein [Vicinamibacterales bacterium]